MKEMDFYGIKTTDQCAKCEWKDAPPTSRVCSSCELVVIGNMGTYEDIKFPPGVA